MFESCYFEKTLTKPSWGGKGLSILEGGQGKSSRQNPGGRSRNRTHKETLLSDLLPRSHLCSFPMQHHLPTATLDLLHELIIKKCPTDIPISELRRELPSFEVPYSQIPVVCVKLTKIGYYTIANTFILVIISFT